MCASCIQALDSVARQGFMHRTRLSDYAWPCGAPIWDSKPLNHKLTRHRESNMHNILAAANDHAAEDE
eukprot:scaffold221514_cov18-Prasinocladus_malaysianus.AAC.1